MCYKFRLGLEAYFEKKEDIPEPLAYYQNHLEVFPKYKSPIWTKEGKILFKQFGFSGQNNFFILNAKSETLKEKSLFRPYLNNRCIIPIIGFYEWSQSLPKTNYYFQASSIQYLIGLYKEDEFVVLTKDANIQVKDVHDRMPILLSKKDALAYLNQTTPLKELANLSSTFLQKQVVQ